MLHSRHNKQSVGKYCAPALRMGIALIRVLSESAAPMRLSDLARAISTNKNTTTRLLSTLIQEGWVEIRKPGPLYALTLMPFSVASRVISRLNIGEAARTPLRELWEETGESVYLSVLHNNRALHLLHFDAMGPVKIAGQVGGRYKLYCTAPGKLLLAFAGENALREVLAEGLKRNTGNTITTEKALRAELAVIRRQDFATDNEELGRGLICYAAPVRDYSGQVAGIVGSSATTIDWTLADFAGKVGKKISRAASLISKQMGYDGNPVPGKANGQK